VITRDAFQIQAKESGKFLRTDFRSPGFTAGEKPRPTQWLAFFEEDPFAADIWRREHAARTLADERYPIQRERMRIVPAPRCGCCGSLWWRDGWSDSGPLKLVVDAVHPAAKVWRCEKHLGRNPCSIEGCGKTFAHKGDDGYDCLIMCGRCWRQAPKWMRDRASKIRRLAKRRGWTDQLCRIHHMAWQACRRWIERARMTDIAEVELSSAPPPAGMMAELQRLGL
jgi:hypothetical protein